MNCFFSAGNKGYHMAAPIAHIFLAVAMVAGPFKGLFDEREFIIGTMFPDIDKLGVIVRAESHFCTPTLVDIVRAKNSFEAGVLFHLYVDKEREKYVVNKKLYELISLFMFKTQVLKIAEDEILVLSGFDVTPYIPYFDTTVAGERTFSSKITQEHLKQWHTFVQKYCKGNWSRKQLVAKYFELRQPHAWFIKRWIVSWYYGWKVDRAVSSVIRNEQARAAILDFYVHFAKRLSEEVKNIRVGKI